MKLTAQQIVDKLINEDQILTQAGQITFFLGEVEIIELNLKGTREEIRNECLRVVSNKILRKIESFQKV